MGDLRNGGSPPDDGGEPFARGLPGLPPDWGEMVVPDDLSELDAEVTAIRRELGRQSVRVGDREPVALRVPIAIMVVAVLMALVSLVVVTWGRAPVQPVPAVSLSAGASAGVPDLSDVILRDASGAPAALAPLLPAVVLLVDRCACADLVRDVARTAPATVTVVVIGPTLPGVTSLPGNVRVLADPAARLSSLFAPSSTGATVIMVDGTGRAVATARGVHAAADLGPITVG